MAFLLLNDRKSIGKVNDMSVIRVAVVEDDELEIRKVTEYLERFRDENGLALNEKKCSGTVRTLQKITGRTKI